MSCFSFACMCQCLIVTEWDFYGICMFVCTCVCVLACLPACVHSVYGVYVYVCVMYMCAGARSSQIRALKAAVQLCPPPAVYSATVTAQCHAAYCCELLTHTALLISCLMLLIGLPLLH